MSERTRPFRILVIQLWTTDPEPIASALRYAGIDAAIERVDFEAALVAALARERFDLAIYDPSTPGLTRDAVERCIAGSGRELPLVALDDLDSIGARVLEVLVLRRN